MEVWGPWQSLIERTNRTDTTTSHHTTGQILFGVLGDQFGRKWTFISTAVLTVFGTILQACAQPRMMGLNIWQQVRR